MPCKKCAQRRKALRRNGAALARKLKKLMKGMKA